MRLRRSDAAAVRVPEIRPSHGEVGSPDGEEEALRQRVRALEEENQRLRQLANDPERMLRRAHRLLAGVRTPVLVAAGTAVAALAVGGLVVQLHDLDANTWQRMTDPVASASGTGRHPVAIPDPRPGSPAAAQVANAGALGTSILAPTSRPGSATAEKSPVIDVNNEGDPPPQGIGGASDPRGAGGMTGTIREGPGYGSGTLDGRGGRGCAGATGTTNLCGSVNNPGPPLPMPPLPAPTVPPVVP